MQYPNVKVFCLTLQNLDVGMRLNYEHNVEAAMSVLPNMVRGIDVNVRFTGLALFIALNQILFRQTLFLILH